MAMDLSRDERLFYIALWNDADDEGRFLAHPRRLLGAIFPYDSDLSDEDVERFMLTLRDTGRLVLYEVGGEPYGQLTKFSDHQKISKPTPSRIPPPPKELGTLPERSRNAPGTLPEDSGPRARAPDVDLGSRSRDLGDGSAAAARARDPSGLTELRELLGDRSEAAESAALSIVGSATWPRGVVGLYGPSGTRRHELAGLDEDQVAQVLAESLVVLAGEVLRRVTTHLKGVPKPWLGGWAAKQVAGYALQNRAKIEAMLDGATDDEVTRAVEALLVRDRIPRDVADPAAIKAVYDLLKGSPWEKRDAAGDRGTAVHHTIEAFLRDEPIPDGLTEDEYLCAMHVEELLKERRSKILGVELTVFSPRWGYAGTLDLWDIHDGVTWVLDHKTSGAIYVEHAIQQAAYLNAEWAVVEKAEIGNEKWVGRLIPWGPSQAQRAGIVHVRPDGAEIHPLRPDVLELLWITFRAAKHMKAFQSDTDDFYSEPKVRIYEDPIFAVGEENPHNIKGALEASARQKGAA